MSEGLPSFVINPAGCYQAAGEHIMEWHRLPWYRFFQRRRHLREAYLWIARARKIPMTEIIAGFAHCRTGMDHTARNPSESEIAGPR